MQAMHFKAKKTFSIRFADGQVKKVVGYEENGQTGDFSVWIRPGHFQKALQLDIPKDAVIGLGQTSFIMKGSSYCFCCHSFTSVGTRVPQGSDEITMLTEELIEKDKEIKALQDQVLTLQCDISDRNKTEQSKFDQRASDLKKLHELTPMPVMKGRRGRMPLAYDYYPDNVQPTQEEGEEVES